MRQEDHQYFAEHLRNVGQVVVNVRPPATLKCRGRVCLIDGSSKIALPASVVPTFTGNERVSRAGIRVSGDSEVADFSDDSIAPPSELKCSVCRGPLLNRAVKWRQLPSAHWAELMDVWHCHKPHDEADNKPGLYYLAFRGFEAKPGRAFYDHTRVIVHKDDLCHRPPNSTESLQIWMWDAGTPQLCPYFASLIAQRVDAHGVYTFLFGTDDKQSRIVVVWVLNVRIEYSSTNQKTPTQGMKVLWSSDPKALASRPDAERVAEVQTQALVDQFHNELKILSGQLPADIIGNGPRLAGFGWDLAVLPYSRGV